MKELWKNIKFAWIYAKEQKYQLFLYTICSMLTIIISVIAPILSAKIIVNLTNNELLQVIYVALTIFIVEVLRNYLNFLCHYFSQVTYRETFTRLQLDLGKSILKLTNTCIDENSSGVFIQRLTNDTSKIADIFNLLNFELADVIMNIGIFGAILIIDLRLFVYTIVMVFLIGITDTIRAKKKNKKDKSFRIEQEKVSGFIGELVRGVRDIKMLNAEKTFLKELNNKLISLNEKRYLITKIQRQYHFLTGSLRDFFDFSIICLLVYLISKNEITIPVALVVYNYSKSVTYIINSYSYLIEGIKDFNLSTTRIFEIIYGNTFPKEKFGKKTLQDMKGNFEFRNVYFSYQENKPVLTDLSFKVKAYKTVAFVGKSGSGKTTIFNLLCKMYDVNEGKILLDGVDINELNRTSIREHITIINQNPYIFNLSIRDNLKLVKENLTEEEMMEACKIACLDDFINSLPDKYDTIVGEGGISLSGGQRQRLAIARALVQKTKIILFDEATSALDNETQLKIQEAINNLQGEYTILIIAHRLSTIINCDSILFLEDGCIKAEGTHEELLQNCKNYKKLYQGEIMKEK